jgi:hypothetical protein
VLCQRLIDERVLSLECFCRAAAWLRIVVERRINDLSK